MSPIATSRTVVSTQGAPAAIGPYSQAIVAGGLVHCSGQIGMDPATGELVEGGVEAQAERALANLCAVLAAAGSSPARAVKCNVFLADMADFAVVNAIYEQTFSGPEPPARAYVAARELPKGALFEVDCVALVEP